MVKVKEVLSSFTNFTFKKTIVATAVGLSMATAFNKIVSSFVSDLIMPLFMAYIGMDKIKKLKYTLIDAYTDQNNIHHAEIALKYGHLVEAILNFLIVSFGVFIFYQIFNHLWNLEQNKD